MAATVPDLIGRDAELVHLRRAVDAASEHGAALLIRGAAGIGKTSLLTSAVAEARSRDYRVLTMTGVESEAQLPYAGLHQLLHPVIGQAERLPSPQRSAVRTALGMTPGQTPEMFLVALATLNLVEDVGGDSPVIIAADDVQWLDGPSASVLTFIVRRVEPTNMLVIATIRDGYETASIAAGVPELRIDALGESAARGLLDAVAPNLSIGVKKKVLDEALGNPLALIELPRALEPTGPDEYGRLPLTDRLKRAFSARAGSLPEATQAAILLAALDEAPTVSEVLRASRELTGAHVTAEVLGPAVDRGLISLQVNDVGFAHPLIRSAVVEAAPPSRRREAHRAMAAAVDEPDRRAWHRAAAILGTDDDVAADLEATAERAQTRGASAIALHGLELAARLTSDARTRARRLLAAAEIGFELGQPAAVGRLLDAAERLPVTPSDRTRMLWLREIFHDGVPGDADTITRLVAAARDAMLEGDRHLASNLLRGAGLRCWWADPGPAVRELVVQAVEDIDSGESDARALEILSLASPVDAGARVAQGVAHAIRGQTSDAARLQVLGVASHAVGDYGEALALLRQAAPGLLSQGKLGLLAQALVVRAWDEIHVGQFADAARDAEDAYDLAVETEQPIRATGAKIARALLAGLRGDEELASRLCNEAEAAAFPLRVSDLLAVLQLARGLAAMTAGRHSEAFDHFVRMFDPRDVAFNELESYAAAGYIVECGAAAERVQEAREVMIRLESLGNRTPAALLHSGLRYSRAVLAGDSEAEASYKVALEAEPKWPFDYARLQMAYGRWLRRQRRVIDSRPYLRSARDAFVALGVPAWADSARRELRASGERAAEPLRAPQPTLSPQELQVAQMAASGLSNREIGDRLFLSHRTVEAHLYRVYPKLGIVSRSELGRALAALEPALTGDNPPRLG